MFIKSIIIACSLSLLIALCAGAQGLPGSAGEVIKQLIQGQPDSTSVKKLLKLGKLYLYNKDNSYKNLDTALRCYDAAVRQSNQLHAVKWQVECIKFKALYLLSVNDLDKGNENFKKVIGYYHHIGDRLTEANNWMEWGDNLPAEKPALCELKINCFKRAELLYQQLNNPLKETDALQMIADVHLNEGKLDLSQKELTAILAKYRSLHYPYLQHTYYLLGAISALKGDLQKELFFYTEAVKFNEASADTTNAFVYDYKLARTYQKLELYNNSVLYFKKSLKYLPLDDYEYYVVMQRIVESLIAQNKAPDALDYLKKHATHITPDNLGGYRIDMCLANCYEALGQNKKAEYFYLKMNRESEIDHQRNFNPDESRIQDLKRVCDFYLSTKQYQKANAFLAKILHHPKNLVSAAIFGQIAFIQFKLDSASGNYLSAIRHFEQHKRQMDSMFSATKSKQISELLVRFESDKKDKNIQSLEKQSQVEKAELEERQVLGRVSTAGLILLLLLLGVLYNRYLLKQRSVKLLQESEKTVSKKNIVLAGLLKDNEWLLKEVHHRVKNNLHMIANLLRLQASYITDATALDAIVDSQNRVRAMSLIHQKLYKTDNTSSVYMPEYIGELIENLKDSYRTGFKIAFKLDVMPLIFDVLHALPIGLILNEVITNSIKYAFPGSDQDQITVKLSSTGNEISLYVADNGNGLPEGFNIENADSFGMILIQGLVDDIGGELTVKNKNGTAISLTFSNASSMS